jgi:hypothetical protein
MRFVISFRALVVVAVVTAQWPYTNLGYRFAKLCPQAQPHNETSLSFLLSHSTLRRIFAR